MNTREKGSRGEERAAEYLLQNGYTILSRNYQTRRGEIDCIAEAPDGTLVFVEVKTAYGPNAYHPFFQVHRGKQMKIASLARQYLAEHQLSNTPCRFDVIAVQKDTIDHLKNAFLA